MTTKPFWALPPAGRPQADAAVVGGAVAGLVALRLVTRGSVLISTRKGTLQGKCSGGRAGWARGTGGGSRLWGVAVSDEATALSREATSSAEVRALMKDSRRELELGSVGTIPELLLTGFCGLLLDGAVRMNKRPVGYWALATPTAQAGRLSA